MNENFPDAPSGGQSALLALFKGVDGDVDAPFDGISLPEFGILIDGFRRFIAFTCSRAFDDARGSSEAKSILFFKICRQSMLLQQQHSRISAKAHSHNVACQPLGVMEASNF